MDAQNVCAFHQGDGVEDGGTVESVFRGGSQQFVNHRFAGDTDQQRVSEFREYFQILHQEVVLFEGLAETEAWVEDDVVDGVPMQKGDLFPEKLQHLAEKGVCIST